MWASTYFATKPFFYEVWNSWAWVAVLSYSPDGVRVPALFYRSNRPNAYKRSYIQAFYPRKALVILTLRIIICQSTVTKTMSNIFISSTKVLRGGPFSSGFPTQVSYAFPMYAKAQEQTSSLCAFSHSAPATFSDANNFINLFSDILNLWGFIRVKEKFGTRN